MRIGTISNKHREDPTLALVLASGIANINMQSEPSATVKITATPLAETAARHARSLLNSST